MGTANDFEQLCDAARDLLDTPPFGLLTDIDGTVSAIAATPLEAVVSPGCKTALKLLAEKGAIVAAISGRSVQDAYEMVRLEDVVYFGNHGLERIVKGERTAPPELANFQPMLAGVMDELQRRVDIPGLIFENKGLSGSIHYRLSRDREFARDAILRGLEAIVDPGIFRISEGKLVVEIKPETRLNKGSALRWLAETYSLSSAIYLGDDRTDIDAMRVLKELKSSGSIKGISIVVAGLETSPSVVELADFVLDGVTDVERFLGWISDQFSTKSA